MNDNDVFTKLIARYCVMEVEAGKSEAVPAEGHFLVVAGPNSRTLKSEMEKVKWGLDHVRVLDELDARATSARSEGHKHIVVRVWRTGGTGYLQTVRLQGAQGGEGGEDDAPTGMSLPASYAMVHDRQSSALFGLTDRFLQREESNRDREFTMGQKLLEARVEVAQLRAQLTYANDGGMARAAEAIAPALAPAANTLAQAMLAYALGGRPPPAARVQQAPPRVHVDSGEMGAAAGPEVIIPEESAAITIARVKEDIAGLFVRFQSTTDEERGEILAAAKELVAALTGAIQVIQATTMMGGAA